MIDIVLAWLGLTAVCSIVLALVILVLSGITMLVFGEPTVDRIQRRLQGWMLRLISTSDPITKAQDALDAELKRRAALMITLHACDADTAWRKAREAYIAEMQAAEKATGV